MGVRGEDERRRRNQPNAGEWRAESHRIASPARVKTQPLLLQERQTETTQRLVLVVGTVSAALHCYCYCYYYCYCYFRAPNKETNKPTIQQQVGECRCKTTLSHHGRVGKKISTGT